jgi:spermidine/putrescine transport system permease protein
MVLPLYANLEKHSPALLDAAQDLGSNLWERFWHVTWPLSLPGVFAGSILVFVPVLGMFAIPELLGGTNGIMIANVIKQQFVESRDWPFGSVLSMVITAVAILTVWVGARFAQSGVASA